MRLRNKRKDVTKVVSVRPKVSPPKYPDVFSRNFVLAGFH